jgi:hypothetical protein
MGAEAAFERFFQFAPPSLHGGARGARFIA